MMRSVIAKNGKFRAVDNGKEIKNKKNQPSIKKSEA